jgi:hypothetical protein
MKHETKLLRLSHVKPLPSSVNGNPRWKFYAREANGVMQEFKTASDVSSAYGCNLNCVRAGRVIRARIHETATGTLMVNVWDDSRSAQVNLDDKFDALELKTEMSREVRDPQTPSTQTRL